MPYSQLEVLDRLTNWLKTEMTVSQYAEHKGIPLNEFVTWAEGKSHAAVYKMMLSEEQREIAAARVAAHRLVKVAQQAPAYDRHVRHRNAEDTRMVNSLGQVKGQGRTR
ncbi:hypothetical protein ACH4C6_34345 [Streptomyces sp. NPDC017943]|uniref:hypothetical protein n=1 Tax=Streptomyces sp. NPDC017943 TaxID=3365019 RepID=UPI0037910C77